LLSDPRGFACLAIGVSIASGASASGETATPTRGESEPHGRGLNGRRGIPDGDAATPTRGESEPHDRGLNGRRGIPDGDAATPTRGESEPHGRGLNGRRGIRHSHSVGCENPDLPPAGPRCPAAGFFRLPAFKFLCFPANSGGKFRFRGFRGRSPAAGLLPFRPMAGGHIAEKSTAVGYLRVPVRKPPGRMPGRQGIGTKVAAFEAVCQNQGGQP